MKEEYCIIAYKEPNIYICEMCDYFLPKVKSTIAVPWKARRFSDEDANALIEIFKLQGIKAEIKRVVVEYSLKNG